MQDRMSVDHGQFGLARALHHVASEPRRLRMEPGVAAVLHHEYDLHVRTLAERCQALHEEARDPLALFIRMSADQIILFLDEPGIKAQYQRRFVCEIGTP